MSVAVGYGVDSSLELSNDGGRNVAVCGPTIDAVTNVPAAVAEALAVPVGYPPLSQACVAGDTVAVCVDRFVPHAGEVVRTVVEQLEECGIEPNEIVVVDSDGVIAAEAAAFKRTATISAAAKGIEREDTADDEDRPRYLTHDPLERGKLALLTNTRSGRPVYLNRELLDADMLIVVGCLRPTGSWNYRGVLGGVYPTFSDEAAQTRFRNPRLLDPFDDAFRRSQDEIDRVGWQAGCQFTVQVIPAAGEQVGAVCAGEVSAVDKYLRKRTNDAWSSVIAGRADLIVAAVNGGAAQTWEHVGRALGAALEAVEEGGAIALCTDLAEPLGPALTMLSQTEDRDDAVGEIQAARPTDAFVALTLAAAQRRSRVYLLSKLDADVVEDLGIAPIDDPRDVGRLVARRKSCMVLNDAQYLRLAVG